MFLLIKQTDIVIIGKKFELKLFVSKQQLVNESMLHILKCTHKTKTVILYQSYIVWNNSWPENLEA